MSVKRGEPVGRPPIGRQICCSCGVEVTDEMSRWDHERRTFVCSACGIVDPVGGSR